jgi:hypothetical protein
MIRVSAAGDFAVIGRLARKRDNWGPGGKGVGGLPLVTEVGNQSRSNREGLERGGRRTVRPFVQRRPTAAPERLERTARHQQSRCCELDQALNIACWRASSSASLNLRRTARDLKNGGPRAGDRVGGSVGSPL